MTKIGHFNIEDHFRTQKLKDNSEHSQCGWIRSGYKMIFVDILDIR